MNHKRKILALDGGGIKGILAAGFLETLEEETGKRIADYFDLIVGTSTGGIIALGLGLGLSAREIVQFYLNEGHHIFDQASPFDKLGLFAQIANIFKKYGQTAKQLIYPKYDSQKLKEALERAFESRRLGDSKVRLVIPAYNVDTESIYLFKTQHHSRLRMDHKESAVDVALATAAAPTFFKAHEMPNGSPLIDGGIWANNPSGLAAVEARGILGWKDDDLYILSVGCSEEPIKIPTHAGLVDAGTIINLFMQGQSRLSGGTAKQLSGHSESAPRYFRYQPKVAAGKFSLDGVEMIKRMRGVGQTCARDALEIIEDTFLKENEKAEPFEPLTTKVGLT